MSLSVVSMLSRPASKIWTSDSASSIRDDEPRPSALGGSSRRECGFHCRDEPVSRRRSALRRRLDPRGARTLELRQSEADRDTANAAVDDESQSHRSPTIRRAAHDPSNIRVVPPAREAPRRRLRWARAPVQGLRPVRARWATSRARSSEIAASVADGNRFQTILGATGTGQDGDDGLDDREAPAPGARHRAQQDARRAALQRVPRVLPRERGRVLRLVLRLLPARGVHPAGRPLHREGLVAERRHRAAPAVGHVVAPHSPRRRRRRIRVVHLRPRLARGVARARAHARGGGGRTTATRCCAS